MSNDTLNFFIDELKRFINSPDVFGVNKKVTAEITVIKMTSPSSVMTFDSLADRVSRLESSLKNGVVTVNASETKAENVSVDPEEVKGKSVASPTYLDELSPEKSTAPPKSEHKKISNREVFEHVGDFVRKYGEKEPMNKFFMEAAKILLKGTDLVIVTDSFGVSMLNSPRSVSTALEIAKELDPSVSSVKVIEGKGTDTETTSENSDLDTF